MSRCEFITQKEIKQAFKNISTNAITNIVSKEELTIKLAAELNMTKGELKAQHLTAFLVCYMKDLEWSYDPEVEAFKKIEFNASAKAVVKGLQAANWSYERIQNVIKIIKTKYNGIVTSSNIDDNRLFMSNKDLGITTTILLKEVK